MFDLRTAAADDGDLEPFPFIGLDGKTHELPNARSLTGRQASQMQQDLDGVLREVAPDVAEMMLDLRTDQIEKIAEAWINHAREGASEAGKSTSSSASSPATARPSRRTSRSAASRTR
jgi:hypothetical protein